MSWRFKKRLIYLTIFFLIIVVIFFLIYLKIKKNLPQCLNNRQDINEEGIDCGGVCPPCELNYFKPFQIYPVKILVYSDKSFDILGIIENLNQNLGVEKLKYSFLIYDVNNNLRFQTPIKETILLPLEKRYLTEINQFVNFIIGRVELKIFEPKKEDFIKKEFEKLPFTSYNYKIYKENNRWKISFTVFNNSYKNQKDIEVIVLIYKDENLIGVTKGIYSFGYQEIKNITFTLPDIPFEPNGFEIYFQKTSL